LPAGLTGGPYNAVAKTFTISGTPTVAGIFKDTVLQQEPAHLRRYCLWHYYGQNQNDHAEQRSGHSNACINTGITTVIYTLGGTATGASITAGALPAGVTGFVSGTSFIISGTPTASGTLIIR